MEGEKEDVNLLWTGGWESTYRLCELIFLKKRIVNPVYILDPERKSFREEIKAMVAIRGEIVKRISSDASLLKPLQIVIKDDIPPNKIITEMYDSIVKAYGGLGRQYEWLARYADWKGLRRLEIGVESNLNTPRRPIFLELEKLLITYGDGFVMGDKDDNQLLGLFGYFGFPLFYKTKYEILQLAQRQDFYDLMLKTWFCHNPRTGKPCGICKPCQQAMSEGLGFRIPLSGKLKYAFKKLF